MLTNNFVGSIMKKNLGVTYNAELTFYNELYVHVLRTYSSVTVKNPNGTHGYSW